MIESLFARANYNSCEVTHEGMTVDAVATVSSSSGFLKRRCHGTSVFLFLLREQSLLFGVSFQLCETKHTDICVKIQIHILLLIVCLF